MILYILGAQFSVPIRLYGGQGDNEGTVEIYYNGRWGTICALGWTISDASVVCAQLGYPGIVVMVTSCFNCIYVRTCIVLLCINVET